MFPFFPRLLASAVATLALALAPLHAGSPPNPFVVQAGLVSPTTLSLTLRDGTFVRGGQEPHVPQPADEIRVPTGGYLPGNTPQLWRDGIFVGWLVANRTVLTRPDHVVAPLPDRAWLDRPDSFQIQSDDDPRFTQPRPPARLDRKSMPHGTTQGVAGVPDSKRAVVHHTIYLHLDQAWRSGAHYRVSFPAKLAIPPLELTVSDLLPSEAIHATQIGFSPEDPAKVAYLSCWLGTGGGQPQAENTPFHVVDARGEIVFSGVGQITTRATDNEGVAARPRNLNLTDVVLLDFSAVRARGEYRVVVPGVGCSAAITIADGVWQRAFTHVMRYYYAQRSGIALRPPYSTFHRPRNNNPADGVRITQSTLSLMDSKNGLKALGTDKGSFAALAAGDTGVDASPDTWGGYADSGDWDRRIQHLQATRLQLDLLLEGGDPLANISLNLPESGNGLPDLLNEALYNLDFYRRLMTPEGGVRGGVESAEHPKTGETSWQDSFAHFVYAPDVWSSYVFTASAARCATYADGRHPEVAATYRAAALKAMNWAETERARLSGDYLEKITPGAKQTLQRARHLAAADLFRLTGEPRWEELFIKTWEDHSPESLWVYLQTERPRDSATLARCRENFLADADRILADQNGLGFRWTRSVPGVEDYGWGVFSFVNGTEVLLRAHLLTGEVKYHQAALLATQMALGANPNNMTYISGLGWNPMRNIFHLDTRLQGLECPPGFVAFGPMNPNTAANIYHDQISGIAKDFVPSYRTWPQTEACVDSSGVHPVNEHLPDLNGWLVYYYGTLSRLPRHSR